MIVEFENGEPFTATFFTLVNLHTLFDRYKQIGECSGDLYIRSTHTIVLQQLTRQNAKTAWRTCLPAENSPPHFGDRLRTERGKGWALAYSCLNFEAAYTAAPQPDPRSHARPKSNR